MSESDGKHDHEAGSHADDIEEFAGGEIRVRHGTINGWLLVVYLGLFVWGVYYLFAYWGGLGPGLAY
jgi:hypothetical protein